MADVELFVLDRETVNSFGCDRCDNVAEFTVVKKCHNQVWLHCGPCVDKMLSVFNGIVTASNVLGKKAESVCKNCGNRNTFTTATDLFTIEPLHL